MGAVNTCVGHSRFWILIDAGLVTREAAGGGEVRHRSQMKSNGGIWRRRGENKIKSQQPLLHWESSSSPSLLVFHPLTIPHPLPLPLPHLLLLPHLLPLPIALPHPLLSFYLYLTLSLTRSLYLTSTPPYPSTHPSLAPSTSPSPSPSDSTSSSPSPSLPRSFPELSRVFFIPHRGVD